MSEEEVIKQIKDMIIAFDVQGYIREKGVIKEELKASNVLQEMLDLYNKQKEEIERLKNDKKKALNYINQEMYVDTNPTICEKEDEENTIIELPISLNLYNEDLRKLFDLLEEE